MWNSLRSLRILSVTSLAVKVGEVKMKLSSSIFSNSAFKASKAYIEKHEAAILSRDLGFSVALRSSPNNRVMLSISSMFLLPIPSVYPRIGYSFQTRIAATSDLPSQSLQAGQPCSEVRTSSANGRNANLLHQGWPV